MSNGPLRTRYLTLETIAELWAPELRHQLPQDELLRLLRLGIINVDRIRNGLARLEIQPPDHQLPKADSRVDWEWMVMFCHKQEFPYPRFWGPEEKEPVKGVGQPDKNRNLIMQLFHERVDAGELKSSCAAEARELRKIALKQADPAKVPVARYIENLIRSEYNEIKNSPKQ